MHTHATATATGRWMLQVRVNVFIVHLVRQCRWHSSATYNMPIEQIATQEMVSLFKVWRNNLGRDPPSPQCCPRVQSLGKRMHPTLSSASAEQSKMPAVTDAKNMLE